MSSLQAARAGIVNRVWAVPDSKCLRQQCSEGVLGVEQGLVPAVGQHHPENAANCRQQPAERAGTFELNDVEICSQEGNRLLAVKRYEEAISVYERALELKPNACYAWQQRGEAMRQLQRFPEAIASYNRAIEFSANPISRYQALNAKGALLFELQLYEEAIGVYNQSLAIFPKGMGSIYILEMKGMAMSKLRRYDEAETLFEKAYNKAVEVAASTAGFAGMLAAG
ncbi:tetratricopeptide repeat protein [Kamptonema formosum]|uniref:tetratricopeptide repeat protein n=1 Tax=Kamptonema formosum TaxID=331992 RepID=UPI000348D277|nr:tetratricopeptide repeat protein [Oscillatoria sp. PCC 10802]